MKGKSIKDFDIFESLSTGFGGMLMNNDYESRVVKNTESDDFEVDTCYCNDTGIYETGITSKKLNDEKWIIVDEYRTKEEAKKGHAKWVKHMKTNTKELFDVHINKLFTK